MSNLTEIINDSFIQFSGSVLQSRALVDVRDCLKPSARQIFYCMYTDKFIHSKPFQKTLKAIGSAFRMYIHGDSSAEGVIMRAAQPFSFRYPLVECEGSYGTLLSSSSWAAPRYTGARLSELSNYLFQTIDKDTVLEWRDNYDNTEQYPMILPSKGYYNICNGTFGLGVGASSSIPQFNVKEVNKALEVLLLNPNADFEEICCMPDFATGAVLLNADEVKESLKNGKGAACKLRSVIEWDSNDRCFVVKELPYMVYTETICGELEKILDSDDNPGIERFNDLTGEKPLIKIYISKRANLDKALKYLYKNTSLQYFYGINMTMLENGRFPKVFTWKEALQAHIDHEKIIYRRGFEFDLEKLEKRIHIINGLLRAYDAIDEVIQTIKTSANTSVASAALQKLLEIDEVQAKAILDLKLARLSKLDITKLVEERENLQKEADHINEILNNEQLFNQELIKGWKEVSKNFGDERRTKILNVENENDEVIEKKQLSLSFTNKGAVFVNETSSLYTQRRNGVGNKFKLDKDEFIVDNLIGDNTDTILFFTKAGNFYHSKLNEFEVGVKQWIEYADKEIVSAAILEKSNKTPYIIFVTKNGLIKKSKISEYNLKRNMGSSALKLDKGDEICNVIFCNDEKIGFLSEKSYFIMLDSSKIAPIGRVTRGVIGMKLGENDKVRAAHAIKDSDNEIVCVSDIGNIKRVKLSDFKVTGRGTKGVKLENTVDFLTFSKKSDIIIISNVAQIKIKYDDIPLLSKEAVGVKSLKLNGDSRVIKLESTN